MSAAAASQGLLELSDDLTLSTSEAARRLYISRARLAELVLSGELELLGPPNLQQGRVRVTDVDRLVTELVPEGGVSARMKLPEGLLPRTLHAAVHLLADWGIADKTSLRYAMKLDYNTMFDKVNALVELGYAQQIGTAITLTSRGQMYVEEYPRVS